MSRTSRRRTIALFVIGMAMMMTGMVLNPGLPNVLIAIGGAFIGVSWFITLFWHSVRDLVRDRNS